MHKLASNVAPQVVENMAITTLIELGVLDALAAGKGHSLGASELAKLCNCDEGVVGMFTRGD